MHYEPDPLPRPAPFQAVRDKVTMPGTFLAVVGALNSLLALWSLIGAVQSFAAGEQKRVADLRKNLWDQLPAEAKDAYQKMGVTPESLAKWMPVISVVWGSVALLAGIVSLFGGLRMMKLRSHGLAVAGAIFASIPIVSYLGCCGFGEIVGIWALIVLFNSDVKAAFGTSPPSLPDEGMLS